MPLTIIQIIGDLLHGQTDEKGGPIKIGGKSSDTTPSAVISGERVNAYFDTFGRQHVSVDNTISVGIPLGAATEATLEFGNVFFGSSIKFYSLTENTLTSVHQFFNTSGGSTLAALIVTYTDSTKETISTIQRMT